MKTAPKQTRSDSNRSAIEAPQDGWQSQLAQVENNSKEAVAQRAFIAGINDSPRIAAQRQRIANYTGTSQKTTASTHPASQSNQQKIIPRSKKLDDEEKESIQGKLTQEIPAQLKAPNSSGLPDNLKSGIESLSGISLDNVKVHYNSPQPAQLSALAYAQGTDIHVAPGQERHLPHEAWHVVQQAQGRVQPTMQMKDGVPLNDDKGLEHEADMMGEKAVQTKIRMNNAISDHVQQTGSNEIRAGQSNEKTSQLSIDRSSVPRVDRAAQRLPAENTKETLLKKDTPNASTLNKTALYRLTPPLPLVQRAPAGIQRLRNAQKVVKMTLIRGRGLIVAELEDGSKESIKLYYNGKPLSGDYLYDYQTGKLEGPDAQGTPDDDGNLLVFWEPLDTKFDVSGKIPLKVVDWNGSGHRIQAQPELSETMPESNVTYYFATDPEIGGNYAFKWWCENDPSEMQRLGGPLVVQGPTESKWEATWAFPGRHTVVCEVTDKTRNTKERLEFYQKVRTESDIINEAFDKFHAPDYSRFRSSLELNNLNLMQGGLQDQSGDKKPPFISCAGQNPAVPGIAPDLAYNTYTITPSLAAKKFRWFARPQIWDLLPTRQYFGYNKAQFKGVDVYDLATESLSAKFIIADAQVWSIICEEYDGSGQPLGTTATYRQVIQTQSQAQQLAKWRAYMKRSDDAISKIADKKEVGVHAAYANRENGQTMPLQLYVGPSAADPNKVVLVDLLPGVDKVEYSGDSVDAVLSDFATNNTYPKGTIKLEIPPNASGIPSRAKTLDTKGESDWALWSSRVGWTSFGLAAAGLVAAAIPGGQPVAAVLFIAAGATGATAGSLSLYDRLQKAEMSPTGIALDVASIAASIIGGAGAIRALRTGSFALTLTGSTSKFLLYSGFATNAVSGLIISVEGVDQIIKVLDSPMSRGEKISALVRVLGTLILQGVLFALSVREVKQMRGRIGGFLGEELTKKLPTDVLHSLNLLDDKALKALAGMRPDQLTQVAKIARLDSRLANRLASIQGLTLGNHEMGVMGGILDINGQIKLNPAKLAAMSDEEVKSLMQATKALKAAGGDLSQLSVADRKLIDDLSKSAGQRLRFDTQLQQVDKFVSEVGAAADPRGQKLFNQMSDGERRRVYDLVNAKRPGTGNLDKQASDYALGHARSVAEYVELFESYVTQYKEVLKQQMDSHKAEVQAEVQRRLAANPSMSATDRAALPKIVQKQLAKTILGDEIEGFGPRFEKAMAAKVENDLGLAGNPIKAGSGAAQTQATLDANKKALTGRIGSNQVTSGLSDADLTAKVKAIPEVTFGSETAASYHVEKHGAELPPSELTGNKVSDFLTSANKTIHNGSATVKVNQDGSRNVIYLREINEGGVKYSLTAMVNVTDDGKVSLATYMGSKK